MSPSLSFSVHSNHCEYFIFPSYPHSDFVTLNVKEGSSIELECQLSGLKDENYVKWLKDGSEVAQETVANTTRKPRLDVDSEDYKLTISRVSSDDEGIYDCAMLNERREFVIKSKLRYNILVEEKTEKAPSIKLELHEGL
jgi:Immunoglobulin I-set domain